MARSLVLALIPSTVTLVLQGCAGTDRVDHDLDAPPGQLAQELQAELAADGDAQPPAVRAATQALQLALAEAARVGAPPLMVDVEHVGRGRDHDTELMVALDVAALVGGGRLAATRAAAVVAVEQAQAELDLARTTTRFEVERLRARLAEAQEQVAALAALEESAAPVRARFERLALHGWLAPRDVDAARSVVHQVAAERLAQEAEATTTRAELARVAGTPAAQLEATLARLPALAPESPGSPPEGAALLERLPTLRIARAQWLVAEAQVRVATAEQWPALLIGPKAVLASDDWLVGGLARLELPWPPTASAAVDAARAARDEARAQLASALAAAQATLDARHIAATKGAATWRDHSQPLARSRAAQLEAAAARFASDPGELPDWTMAFEQCAEALAAEQAARRVARIAVIDLLEASGAPR